MPVHRTRIDNIDGPLFRGLQLLAGGIVARGTDFSRPDRHQDIHREDGAGTLFMD